MTPAALSAAVNGDMRNFLVAATPGGIEAQEKAGQLAQAKLQTLPIDLGRDRENFEALGFVFGRKLDDLFVEATFPAGWSKRPTDHSMHSEIVDDKGRVRGGIFYKAAFYDQRASAHLGRRFSVDYDYGNGTRTVKVRDEMGIVERAIKDLPAPDWKDRPTAERRQRAIDAANEEIAAWLTANYPDWETPMAHWN